jgi:hypothetical protein
MDIFPPAKQRPALLALRDALGCRDNALRRDECGDWRIEGRSGHIYAVPGSLDRPGFQIFIADTARWWANAKAALKSFTDLANDGDDEGSLLLDRLPAFAEAAILRHYVGLAKKAEYSDEVLARKRDLALMARLLIGQKPASADAPASLPVEAVEGEI